jgi:hypothetical protein
LGIITAVSISANGRERWKGETDGLLYAAFEPIDNVGINITDFNATAKRHVLPAFYGFLAVADAIGTSGNAVSYSALCPSPCTRYGTLTFFLSLSTSSGLTTLAWPRIRSGKDQS